MEWPVSGLIGGVLGGLIAGWLVYRQGLKGPERHCPDCDAPLPRIRKPANLRQLLWGGNTCPQCGCEVNRNGKKIEPAPRV
jgi:ssDNA-binding Zn-finger/Zn-ribbon topoisomerase 1